MYDWTFFVYLAAHNDLNLPAEKSKDELWEIGSSEQVKLTALLHTPSGALFYDMSGKRTGAVGPPTNKEFDSGDPDSLTRFANAVFEKYPAKHYGLILWSHGSGWMPHEIEKAANQRGVTLKQRETKTRAAQGKAPALFRSTLADMVGQDSPSKRAICFDNGSQHSIDTDELGKVMHKVAKAAPRASQDARKRIDLLGMDACLMSSVEVAYQIRQDVDFMVASEELVPTESWPYPEIFKELIRTPGTDPRTLSKQIVNQYVSYFNKPKNRPKLNQGDVTNTAWDLSKVTQISEAMKRLASKLTSEMPKHWKTLWAAQARAFGKETEAKNGQPGRLYSKFQYQLWDVGSVARYLRDETDDATLKQASGDVLDTVKEGGAILKNGRIEPWFDDIAGLSVYLPPPNVSRITPYYNRVAFANEVSWDAMLKQYQKQTS